MSAWEWPKKARGNKNKEIALHHGGKLKNKEREYGKAFLSKISFHCFGQAPDPKKKKNACGIKIKALPTSFQFLH